MFCTWRWPKSCPTCSSMARTTVRSSSHWRLVSRTSAMTAKAGGEDGNEPGYCWPAMKEDASTKRPGSPDASDARPENVKDSGGWDDEARPAGEGAGELWGGRPGLPGGALAEDGWVGKRELRGGGGVSITPCCCNRRRVRSKKFCCPAVMV